MTSTPAVSVIIPAYNVTAFIADALNSLRAQTFRDFETIVVNDGCPDSDNLERVLEPYRGEIVYIRQENQGVAAARNTALRAARKSWPGACLIRYRYSTTTPHVSNSTVLACWR